MLKDMDCTSLGDTVVKWEYSIRIFSSVRYTLARYDEDDTLGIL